MRSGAPHPFRLFEYDALRRRVWIAGQRCHHGATGSLVAAIACLGLVARPAAPGHALRRAESLLALAAGGALMIHDWKDRSLWFELGHGNQP
jgi:hypothetical protein